MADYNAPAAVLPPLPLCLTKVYSESRTSFSLFSPSPLFLSSDQGGRKNQSLCITAPSGAFREHSSGSFFVYPVIFSLRLVRDAP